MKLTKKIANACVVIGLTCIIGCMTSYDEDPMAHMDFKSRSVVEDMSDDDIVVNGPEDSIAAMKKERKMHIAVFADISNQFKGRELLNGQRIADIDEGQLQTSAQVFVRNFLQKVKAYKLEAIDKADLNRALKSADDIDGVKFPFLAKVKVILTSEVIQKQRKDEFIYKCVLEWELIDNRTKANGLGEKQIPTVIASDMCQNVTTRNLMLSASGVAVGGGAKDRTNAHNAYNEVIGNCMSQFYAQLANRVPFGGSVSGVKTLDGDMYFTIKADAQGHGVVKKMQMLLMNEDQDRIAVGEVLVSANGKSNVKIWRWLSKSYRKQLESVVRKGKDEVENWLDENKLYALCLGLPEPPKDMLLDFRSRK